MFSLIEIKLEIIMKKWYSIDKMLIHYSLELREWFDFNIVENFVAFSLIEIKLKRIITDIKLKKNIDRKLEYW